MTLLFSALGIISYLTTKLGRLAEMGMTLSQIAFMETYPAWATTVWATTVWATTVWATTVWATTVWATTVWATTVWAIGVWGAFAGSVLVLLRSKWAAAAMVVALVGLIGVTAAESFLLGVPADMRTPLGLKAAIWSVTLFLLIYSRAMTKAGVLR